jgi:hypothetical protein
MLHENLDAENYFYADEHSIEYKYNRSRNRGEEKRIHFYSLNIPYTLHS